MLLKGTNNLTIHYKDEWGTFYSLMLMKLFYFTFTCNGVLYFYTVLLILLFKRSHTTLKSRFLLVFWVSASTCNMLYSSQNTLFFSYYLPDYTSIHPLSQTLHFSTCLFKASSRKSPVRSDRSLLTGHSLLCSLCLHRHRVLQE